MATTISSFTPGSVTSVGAIVSNGEALLVLPASTPITSAGVLDFQWQGLPTQYIGGDGSLQELPVSATDLSLGTRTGTTMPILNTGGTGVILPSATTTLAGLLTATDKVKLDGLENYILPIASPTILGGVKVGSGLTITSDGILSTIAVGGVSSVGLTMPAAFSVSGSPITSTGTFAVTALGTDEQYIRGDGTLGTFPGTVGSVSSVALSAPSAFTVTGSPITSAGTLTFAGAGTTSQYIDGTGSLRAFPTIPGTIVSSIGINIDGDSLSVSPSSITSSGTFDFNWEGSTLQYVRGDGSLATFPSATTVNDGDLTFTGTGIATATGSFSANQLTDSNVVINVPGTNLSGSLVGSTLVINSSTGASASVSLPTGGTVTSVAATIAGDAVDISGSPITGAGTLGFTFAGTSDQYINGQGNLVTFPAIGGSGTVTSVALTVPSAFSVSGSPITTAGTLSITGTGTTSQYIRGDGSLGDFPPTLGSVTSVDADILSGTALSVVGGPITSTGTFSFDWEGLDSQYVTGAGNLVSFPTIPTYTGSTSILLTGSSFQREALTGDVVAGLNSNTTTISNNAVTFAKMQDIPTLSLIGRYSAGTGDPQTILLGDNLILDTTTGILNTVVEGSVTSVGLSAPSAFTVSGSPVTSTGTLSFTGAGTISQYIDGTGSLRTFPTLPTGTVTSVGVSSTDLSVAGSPITSSGVITLDINNNAVTNAKLRDSVGTSVIGRSANTTGDPSDIVAGTNAHVLRRTGDVLGFGTIGDASITDLNLSKITGVGTVGQVPFSDGTNLIMQTPTWTSNNIYLGNGTLTGPRTLAGASNSLTFNGLGSFIVDAASFLYYTPAASVSIDSTGIKLQSSEEVSIQSDEFISLQSSTTTTSKAIINTNELISGDRFYETPNWSGTIALREDIDKGTVSVLALDTVTCYTFPHNLGEEPTEVIITPWTHGAAYYKPYVSAKDPSTFTICFAEGAPTANNLLGFYYVVYRRYY